MSSPREVLIIDDDHEILEMTSLLLKGAGYEVRTAQSGEEGIFLVQESVPGIVLLDINMPGMDGWEVLRLLKEDELSRELPVVMFSVNFEVREKLHALQQGAVDYVTKPFDTARLIDRIEQVFSTRAAR